VIDILDDRPCGWKRPPHRVVLAKPGSVTYPNGTLQLTYETAGEPTYGNLAIETDDLQRLGGAD
jgi:hypothetical protein